MYEILLIVLVIIVIAFWAFHKFYFLRDPARHIPIGNNIVCPADGKITMIKPYDKNEVSIDKRFLGKVRTLTRDVADKGFIVSIFMNVFNVHINRAPISGEVKYVKHTKGKFLNAETLASTFENENVQILIHNDKFKIKTIQVAGLIARRIVPFVKSDEKLIKGQRIGLIKLGSQVTMILPANVKLKIRKGQKVLAGTTVIAER